MDRDEIDAVRKKIEKNLSTSRYIHTLGVAYTAASLAMRFGEDYVKAEIAGLLHDCAKEYSAKELLKMAEEYDIPVSDAERAAPQVLHAVLGPYVARKKYGVKDPEILSAIRWHTTGKAEMTKLELIVFIADYIEPNRDKAEDLPEVRPAAFQSLEKAALKITEDTLDYLRRKGTIADPNTEQCGTWLRKEYA